jgi:arylsulfatase A-like enzyme
MRKCSYLKIISGPKSCGQVIIVFVILRCFGIFIATGLLACCSWQESRRPSILLIAVEGLGFDTAACNSAGSEPTDGLERICAESVRFTHAYTPSLMSQATLASIFSARFPAEHGVWHNGSQHLSERIETVAEVALTRGYRTSFFSGGPPIWRKSGFDQGFELFDDNITIDLRRFYRPAAQNVDLFLRWLDRETSGEPFFSVIYLPDLQFGSFQTESDLGETRSRTTESQTREVSESIGHLLDQLKKRNRWNNTYVVVTGLNGHTRENRSDEIPPMNLHNENAQVFLVIKPVTKVRDEAIEWSIDSNVTLVDLGATFYDLIGASEGAFLEREFQTNSLLSAIERPAVSWSKDRFILTESAWAQWRGVGSTRYALRQEHFFFLYDSDPKLFNTLIDRQEMSPLSHKDPLTHMWFQKFTNFFTQKNIPAF